MWEIVAITILLAFAFTFTNGFQDASSIAATFIASRSATPKAGILLVTSMSFLGAILGGSAVAFTLTGLVLLPSGEKTLTVLMISLLTASSWNLITWRFALPSSSTHSLVGGLIGGGIAAAGTGSVNWGVEQILSPSHQSDRPCAYSPVFCTVGADRVYREFLHAPCNRLSPAQCTSDGQP